ncbi:MAG TPA: hypothetical protein PKK00_11315 [Bacteroidales bacterium]|nr:hypothetical protein [Bacteroidales bacterium]HPS17916.1 hypothetical protein [Bacteroidales bacterium]
MIQYKKWLIVLFAGIMMLTTFSSCNKHHRFKRMLKHRRSVNVHRHHSPYQRRIKRKTMPINKNYIIKNRRDRPLGQRNLVH